MNQQSLFRYYSKKPTETKKFSQETFMMSQRTDQMHIENEGDDYEHDPWSGPVFGNTMNNDTRINPHTSFIPTTTTERTAEYSLPVDAFANRHNNATKSLFDYYHPTIVPKSLNTSPIGKKPTILSQTSVGETNQQQHHQASKQTSLSQWFSKNEINPVGNKWPYLPKDLIRRVMQYLNLDDNAQLALVCKYWRKCFNSIWLSYDFFGEVNSKEFKDNQLRAVFEKSARLPHIKKMKNLINGKNLDSYFKRTNIKAKVSKDVLSKGKLFEKFCVKPLRTSHSIFFSDKEITDICESSMFSLLYISLKSCNLITRPSFEALSKCQNLQHLTLFKCSFFTDSDALMILNSCKNITDLSFCGSPALTDQTLVAISKHTQKLVSLDLADNARIDMGKLFHLCKLKNLRRINISESTVENDNLISIAKELPLEELELNACKKINDGALHLLGKHQISKTIKVVSLERNRNLSEEALWFLVDQCPNLKFLTYPNDICSLRIEATLKYRQSL